MQIRKPYEEFEKEYQKSGEKIITEHRENIDSKGKRTLIKDRKINAYEIIQASAESCNIQNILRRATEGDLNILNQVNANYIDATGAPSTLAEAQKLIIKTKEEFSKLPYEIRMKYNNDPREYVADYGSESWSEKIGLKAYQESIKETEKLKMSEQDALKDITKKEAITNE